MLQKILRIFRREDKVERAKSAFLSLAGFRSTLRDDVVDPRENAVVTGCLNWLIRHASYVRLVATREGARVDSNLVQLLEGSGNLVGALASDLVLYGNAYCILGKRRLDYVAPWRVRIRGDSYEVIRYDGSVVATSDVVHFRFGVHPSDPRLGLSPLQGALRELSADNGATTTILGAGQNSGVGLWILSPKTEGWLSEQQYDMLRDRLRYYASGDAAGSPVVTPFEVSAQRVSPVLKDYDLGSIRGDLAARICSAIGLDPMVIGLPSPNKTYSNYSEAIDAAYEGCLLPLLSVIADGFTARRDLFRDGSVDRYEFDVSGVRALQEDEDRLARRLVMLWQSGVVSREEVRAALGYPTDPEGVTITEVFSGSGSAETEAATQNGNGRA